MRKKVNILDYLFFCIIINTVPTFLLGTKRISEGSYTKLNIIVYALQTGIMLLCIRKKIKKLPVKTICFLSIFVLLQILAQLVNYLKGESIQNNDIFNMISVTINLFIYIFCLKYFVIDETDLIDFMKKIVYIGIIACAFNIVINGLSFFSITTVASSYSVSFSSFFPNRNQFGIFMLICIIANIYIMRQNRKATSILIQVLFIGNLILTMSRNSILGLAVLYMAKLYLNYKEKNKKVPISIVIFLVIVFAIVILFGIYILSNENILEIVNKLFIRTDNLKSGSGRFQLWLNGINITIDNNFLLGVGRFKGIELKNIIYDSELNSFHSIYIEIFVTYGIIRIDDICIFDYCIIKKNKKY